MAELENPNVMPNLITFLSSLLQKVAESNDVNGQFQPQKISVFHGLTRPTISIQNYLDRIYKYANCSPSCFIVAYVYLDRFAQRQTSLPINSFNVHRLLITSVMVAAKFMDDIFRGNRQVSSPSIRSILQYALSSCSYGLLVYSMSRFEAEFSVIADSEMNPFPFMEIREFHRCRKDAMLLIELDEL
ncbi:cyclin-U4-1 [Herrania umbratica]|uniref:Cyclin-U4-1 n=1 Tax=Herrania umbratica TaxID=108875 RepID=A0A6J0ZYN2_9ROSI|nr:cyclin-U4-1 [Herrania umbratica]